MHARLGVFVCVCLCVCVSECVRGGVACACKNKQKQESKEEEGRDLATWVTHPSLSALSLPRPPLPPLPPLPGPLLWKPHQKQAPPPAHATQRTAADDARVSGGRTPRDHQKVGRPGDGQGACLPVTFLFPAAPLLADGSAAAFPSRPAPPSPRLTSPAHPSLTP